MIVVGSTSAGVCIVGLVIWWLVHSPEITREHGDVLSTAFIFVSVGLVCGSVGTACLNDTLAGVDDCEHSVGWPLFFVGWSLTVLVILGVLFLIFPQYRARVWLFSFGVFAFTTQCVGGACIDDNLVGIDGCDDLLGQIVVAVGSGFMALILIISAAMCYDRWEGQKLLISIPSALGIVGVALGSFGWSCLVDTLAGAKPCEQATGWVLTIIGWGMVFLVYVFLVVLWFRHNCIGGVIAIGGAVGLVVGSVGVACASDTLAGVDDCDETVGAFLAIVGWLGVWLAVSYHVPRKFERPYLILGLWCVVSGLVLSCIGGACIEDSLLGVDDCSYGWGVAFTIIGAVLMVTGIYSTIYHLYQMEKITFGKGWIALGSVFVFGFVLSAVGTGCWTNTLTRIDQCPVELGVLMTMAGNIAMFGALVCGVMWPLFADKLWVVAGAVITTGLIVGSYGAACVDDTLYMVDDCHLGIGITMTVVGWVTVYVQLVALLLWAVPRAEAFKQYSVVHLRISVVGGVLLVTGIVAGSVGVACLNNGLAGVPQCAHWAGMFLTLSGFLLAAIAAVPAGFYAASFKGKLGIGGTASCILVGGIVVGSLGLGCVGSDSCDDTRGIVLMVLGYSAVFQVLVGLGIYYVLFWLRDGDNAFSGKATVKGQQKRRQLPPPAIDAKPAAPPRPETAGSTGDAGAMGAGATQQLQPKRVRPQTPLRRQPVTSPDGDGGGGGPALELSSTYGPDDAVQSQWHERQSESHHYVEGGGWRNPVHSEQDRSASESEPGVPHEFAKVVRLARRLDHLRAQRAAVSGLSNASAGAASGFNRTVQFSSDVQARFDPMGDAGEAEAYYAPSPAQPYHAAPRHQQIDSAGQEGGQPLAPYGRGWYGGGHDESRQASHVSFSSFV